MATDDRGTGEELSRCCRTLLICEFDWQIDDAVMITGSSETKIVSMTPEASYGLRRRSMNFTECESFYRYETAWGTYAQNAANSLALCAQLDSLLWSTDLRFSCLDWRVFDDYHYILKISLDQIRYYLDVLTKVIRWYEPKTIFVASIETPRVDSQGLISHECTLMETLLARLNVLGQYRIIRQTNSTCQSSATPRQHFPYSFGQRRADRRQFVDHAFGQANSPQQNIRRRRILSVCCSEISAVVSQAENDGIDLTEIFVDFESFLADRAGQFVDREWPYLKEFTQRVTHSTVVQEAASHNGTSFIDLLVELLEPYARNLENLYVEQIEAISWLDLYCPTFAIFQSMAPFLPANIYVRNWCIKRSIPYATWMHGGYGGNYSVIGYDVTDLRKCSSHFVWGRFLLDLLSDERCVVKQHKFHESYAVQIKGSARLEQIYCKAPYRPDNPRRRVLFAIGAQFQNNQYHFGMNRSSGHTSQWKAHFEIIKTLAGFQDRYDIIIKDYANSPREQLWRRMISDVGGYSISYVAEQESFDHLVKTTDLHIFPWISTTFFEGLFSDADVFLYDDGDITTESLRILAEEGYCFSDIASMIGELNAYLEGGEFYNRPKQRLRDYYLDFANRARRVHWVYEFLADWEKPDHARI